MRLLDYLKKEGLSDAEFAAIVGLSATPRSVAKWKYGENKPRLPEAVRIEVVTGGIVKSSDFIDDSDRVARKTRKRSR